MNFMCGITGFITKNSSLLHDELKAQAFAMGEAISTRGPDAADVWVNAEDGMALSHRRLSIIDLSSAGAQPMTSACGRYVICYNGEVYNSEELKKDLAPRSIQYRGYSDTELILESCAAFGIDKTVDKLVGMFAFALWDTQRKCLSLVRDRLGIKPLYWGTLGNTFMFGSELKALRAHPDFQGNINHNAVASYLRHSYVPTPASIYNDVAKLQPGHILTLKKGEAPKLKSFWSLSSVIKDAYENPFEGTESEAVEMLDTLLRDCVGKRMIADVPLGAFLSGGIDSSLIAALMQAQSDKPIRSFSIGFHNSSYNEAQHAAEVAKHLGTDHTELYVTPDDIRDIIPNLPDIYDEPFADSSQLPTWLVSKMTRKHVTVALSGDGGDEFFGGYTRYMMAQKFSKTIYAQPQLLRKLEARLITILPPSTWNALGKLIPKKRRPTLFGDKLYKLAGVLEGNKEDFYQRLTSHWENPQDMINCGEEIGSNILSTSMQIRIPNFTDQMQYLDTLTYLPDDILTKVDRASMNVSLEVRVPLLDHRLAEFAWKLPQHMKIHNGQGKRVLRKVLDRYVPRELIERPKMGFAVPVGDWLRGPLKEWASEILSDDNLRKHDFVKPDFVQARWKEHLSGNRNWNDGLWNILMLHSWADRWIK